MTVMVLVMMVGYQCGSRVAATRRPPEFVLRSAAGRRRRRSAVRQRHHRGRRPGDTGFHDARPGRMHSKSSGVHDPAGAVRQLRARRRGGRRGGAGTQERICRNCSGYLHSFHDSVFSAAATALISTTMRLRFDGRSTAYVTKVAVT